MPIGRERLGRILADLVAGSAETRDEAAETVSDWAEARNSFDDFEARMLVRTLALAASVEADRRVRESLLNALGSLFSPRTMNQSDIAAALKLQDADLDPGEREHLDGLRELSDGR